MIQCPKFTTIKKVYHKSFPSEIVEPFFEKEASCESIRAAGIGAMKITYGITNTIKKEWQSRFIQQAHRGKINPKIYHQQRMPESSML